MSYTGNMALFSTVGQATTSALVFAVTAASLALAVVNVLVFRTQARKYRELLRGFGDENAEGRPGRILIPLYVASTLVAAFVTVWLYVADPHVL